MFFEKIEREGLDTELWPFEYKTQLPDHLQLLVDKEQGKRDIWEWKQQPHVQPRKLTNKKIDYRFGSWKRRN